MKIRCKNCNSKKVKYKYSFIYEHVYKCKKCKVTIIVKRNIKEFIGI